MIAVWESHISATFLIFRLKCSTDAAFFKFLGKLFHNMAKNLKNAASVEHFKRNIKKVADIWDSHTAIM